MSDGIHIPPTVVRGVLLAALAGLIAVVWAQLPEARRYLKMERM